VVAFTIIIINLHYNNIDCVLSSFFAIFVDMFCFSGTSEESNARGILYPAFQMILNVISFIQ